MSNPTDRTPPEPESSSEATGGKKKRVLVEWVERLESLATKLPGPLKNAILSEVQPVKEVFLLRRAPRFALTGLRLEDATQFLDGLLPGLPRLGGTYEVSSEPGWMAALVGGKEVVLFSLEPVIPTGEGAADVAMQFTAVAGEPGSDNAGLDCLIVHPNAEIEREHRVREVLRLRRRPGGSFESTDLSFLMRRLFDALPRPAQLSLARLSSNREVQAKLATILVRSATGIAGALGTQPIPLADFPLLAGLQAGMVAGIMNVSGREPNTKHGAEFMTALGANIGLGLVFREATRALVKFIPGWGNAISGGVAAAGTYAIGRAATSYFIEGVDIENARGIFQKVRGLKKRPTSLSEGASSEGNEADHKGNKPT